jgi:hypothetical protein
VLCSPRGSHSKRFLNSRFIRPIGSVLIFNPWLDLGYPHQIRTLLPKATPNPCGCSPPLNPKTDIRQNLQNLKICTAGLTSTQRESLGAIRIHCKLVH